MFVAVTPTSVYTLCLGKKRDNFGVDELILITFWVRRIRIIVKKQCAIQLSMCLHFY